VIEPDSPRRIEIGLHGAARRHGVAARELRRWLADLMGELAPHADTFAARLVGDRTMRALNLRFRGLDKTTDVLSFPGDETPAGRHLGDVVISLPQARRQAESAGHSLDRELRILLLHGALHCLGYDHESDGGEMSRLERSLRRRWIGDEART
jgi:probable rRNA maturation factor